MAENTLAAERQRFSDELTAAKSGPSASSAHAGDSASWIQEQKRLMAMFHTAIAKSQQREAQMSNEANEDRLKYDEEITKLHAQLDASEK
eukprot:7702098-Lingulodinium_polyedra.AAC.1